MREQYAFDPAAVELGFGEADGIFPPWELDLGEGHRLQLKGRIDRIDLCPDSTGQTALCMSSAMDISFGSCILGTCS